MFITWLNKYYSLIIYVVCTDVSKKEGCYGVHGLLCNTFPEHLLQEQVESPPVYSAMLVSKISVSIILGLRESGLQRWGV